MRRYDRGEGIWPRDLGPRPRASGCRVPEHVLAEFLPEIIALELERAPLVVSAENLEPPSAMRTSFLAGETHAVGQPGRRKSQENGAMPNASHGATDSTFDPVTETFSQ